MAQFTQLSLLSPPPSVSKPSSRKRSPNQRTRKSTSQPKSKLAPSHYLAFDDDYFWELIKKDYASAWKYVARMNGAF